MPDVIRFPGTRAEAAEIVRQLPSLLAGRLAGPWAMRVAGAMSVRLAEIVREDFAKKSKGQAGLGGIRWKPDSQATVKRKHGRADVGIDTGELLASIGPDARPGAAAVVAKAEHASHFARDRPIFPDTLPPAVWRELVRAALAEAASIARERFARR